MTRYWMGVASREHVQGAFRRGSFEIPRQDYELIATHMGVLR